ncbi:hypothetical protein ACIQW5_11305 [Methylorubrum thiocyanatum]|uniref:hypothetical protein n=1 Tax=Methylorubrum thiocyanatum TaxID=47958 RepID=UPI00383B5479
MSDRVLFEKTADREVWLIRDGDNMIIETITKVDDIFDANRSKQADFSRNAGLGSMPQVATIPVGMFFEWQKEGIVDDPAAYKRRLNDIDYQHLRTNSLKL